jgi:hypothetical protein
MNTLIERLAALAEHLSADEWGNPITASDDVRAAISLLTPGKWQSGVALPALSNVLACCQEEWPEHTATLVEAGVDLEQARRAVLAWKTMIARGWQVGQFWKRDKSRWGLRTADGFDLPHTLDFALRDREWHDPITAILEADAAMRKLET